ncbi:HAD hydrolase family protein [Sphingoaurantiacus capsulatus]|uniref:HAD hydrolase family protein n=1 Tax=Sphingoaurantiacus capsulatus TaxID=1771310 RepID=A0ABV7X7L5_9SPHN
MSRFGEKLDTLLRTTELVATADVLLLAEALRQGQHRPAVAIGSGGSAITAQYFARCRETLFEAATQVVTPAEFVLANDSLEQSDVWLFSAGANNADSIASAVAARARGAAQIHLLTRNPSGTAAQLLAADPRNTVVGFPVADAKDGFLATHSLFGSVLALLFASDLVSVDPLGEALGAAVIGRVRELLRPSNRQAVQAQFADLRSDDLLLLVADPQLRAIAELIETSVWEAALCPIQRTDLRNFAHGRHTWIHHRGERTIILGLVSEDGADIWERADTFLPPALRRHVFTFGNAGRMRMAAGIIQGLIIVEAIGVATGIDPGKPGIGDFGRKLYEDDGLLALARQFGPAVRHKRAAALEHDDVSEERFCIRAASAERRETLAAAQIGAIVFDYDGTLISDDERFGHPRAAIISELVRLNALGVKIAFATGRGGSGGKALRAVLPAEMHDHVLIGYYNGAYVRQLSVDIEVDRPPSDPDLAQTLSWLESRPDLFLGAFGGRFSDVQISVKLDNLADRLAFPVALTDCPPIASGTIRFRRSGHSIDFFAASTSKLSVVDRLRQTLPDGAAIFCIGDSGARDGNDNELLSHAHGISVGTVCDRRDGCWTLFGKELTGPEALMRLLQAVKREDDGRVRMDVLSLGLDSFAEMSTKREHNDPAA